ncbi:hypothetical protein B484DRAFT_451487 [Ochromonadaceae sp. CCMP2298]|nr:hypothetical protein B484DRAFT_451487 [Ochromonadaceae sp. CCMP2298]
MSNNNKEEEDGYNDDFYEGSHDQDDEQLRQKVNGKMESMQSEIEGLRASLSASRSRAWDLEQQAEGLKKDNEQLRAESKPSESGADVEMLKKKCDRLKEQLSEALSLSPDTCPSPLKEEFVAFCRATDTCPELQERDFTIAQCVKILRIQRKSFSLEGGSIVSEARTMGSKKSTRTASTTGAGAVNNGLNDVKNLRAKVTQMNERIRIEKEYKYRAESDVVALQKKILMLSGHMEKLVLHLKHEGAHKLRLAEQLRVSGREQAAAAEKADIIARKSAAKDRLLLELREGSKVLEDQLRLMDEKYIELRIKLDYARELGVRKIKKAENVARELRVKFAFATGSKILDSIRLPEGGQYNSGNSQYSEQSWGPGGPEHNSSQYSDYGGVRASTGQLGKHGLQGGASLEGGSQWQTDPRDPRRANTNSSVTSSQANREPNMDKVLDKIRLQEGRKQDWTEEKVQKLIKRR